MMRHSKAALYLESYEREELSPALRGRLDEHLASCSECSGTARDAADFKVFLRSVPPEFSDGSFEGALATVRQRTLRAVRTAPGPGALPRLAAALRHAHLRPLFAVPATALVLAFVVVALRPLLVPARVSIGTLAEQAVGSAQISAPFSVVRAGSDVKIEWAHNGRPHEVRTGTDPRALRVAEAERVTGKVWTETRDGVKPGGVMFYLVD